MPNNTDYTDPKYTKKYAHTMPPLEAYYQVLPATKKVNPDEKNNNQRVYFFAWDNLTQYELEQIRLIKEKIKKEHNTDVPEGFSDREVLKFLQGNSFDMNIASTKLVNNFKWLTEVTALEMTPQLLETLQSGVMYLHGRDMNYRPIIVMDLSRVIQLQTENPQLVEIDNMTKAFVFLW